jgi:hypothetical protein
MCLSGSISQPGVALFGSKGPYNFLHGIDLSKSLLYTPLKSIPRPSTSVAIKTHVFPALKSSITFSP